MILEILFFIPQFIFIYLLYFFRPDEQIAFFDQPVMEFIGRMQAVFLAYLPQVIIIPGVLSFLIHHHLYRTFNIFAVFSPLILYESLDWHNHKADSEYLRFSDKLFLKDHVRSILHIPLNFDKMMVRNMELITAADALSSEPLMLSDVKLFIL